MKATIVNVCLGYFLSSSSSLTSSLASFCKLYLRHVWYNSPPPSNPIIADKGHTHFNNSISPPSPLEVYNPSFFFLGQHPLSFM